MKNAWLMSRLYQLAEGQRVMTWRDHFCSLWTSYWEIGHSTIDCTHTISHSLSIVATSLLKYCNTLLLLRYWTSLLLTGPD